MQLAGTVFHMAENGGKNLFSAKTRDFLEESEVLSA